MHAHLLPTEIFAPYPARVFHKNWPHLLNLHPHAKTLSSPHSPMAFLPCSVQFLQLKSSLDQSSRSLELKSPSTMRRLTFIDDKGPDVIIFLDAESYNTIFPGIFPSISTLLHVIGVEGNLLSKCNCKFLDPEHAFWFCEDLQKTIL